MPRIDLESMLRRSGITYAESNFITWFYSQFDNNAAGSGLNRHIVNVEPLCFFNTIALAGEFLVYGATKLYICLEANFGYASADTISPIGVNFYNEADVFKYSISDGNTYMNGVNDFYHPNSVTHKNFYFSRLATLYEFMTFNGFRITLD